MGSSILAVAAFIAFIVPVLSFLLNFLLTRDLSVSQKVSNTTSLFHNEYINREFDIEIHLTFDVVFHLPNDFSTKKITKNLSTKKMDVARDFVRYHYGFGDKSEVGQSTVEEFYRYSTQYGEWQYYFVAEVLHGLQDLGVAVACGAVSLPMVMADTAHTILEDWRYAKMHLRHWRESRVEPIHATDDPSLRWSRRHGEWLVCLAVLYLLKFWRCAEVEQLVSECDFNREKALTLEKKLRSHEWRLSSTGILSRISPIGLLAEIRDLRRPPRSNDYRFMNSTLSRLLRRRLAKLTSCYKRVLAASKRLELWPSSGDK